MNNLIDVPEASRQDLFGLKSHASSDNMQGIVVSENWAPTLAFNRDLVGLLLGTYRYAVVNIH